jgi:Arc/MetJ-type ribon-helix-helix transcriptional regulator
MKTLTVKIDEDTVDELDTEADERGFSSRSEYLREIIDSRHEADEVRQELDQAEARAEDLRRQLQERGEVEEKVETLVERTERQDDALAEVLERQEEGLVGRWKRKLFGGRSDADAVEEDG